MYRVMVLVFALTVVTAEMDESQKKCLRLRHPATIHCCKSLDFSKQFIAPEDLKECMEIPHEAKSCERSLCIGKKKGFVSEDGTFNKEAFEKVFEEDFKGLPTLIAAVKENCLKGDTADLPGPPDMCEIQKIEHCMQRQAINDCTEWDNEGPCAGIKDLVKDCATVNF